MIIGNVHTTNGREKSNEIPNALYALCKFVCVRALNKRKWLCTIQ